MHPPLTPTPASHRLPLLSPQELRALLGDAPWAGLTFKPAPLIEAPTAGIPSDSRCLPAGAGPHLCL